MDKYANCGTILPKVCNLTNHEKSGDISAPVQCQARINLRFEEKIWYSCNLDVFCDKGMAIPQTVGLAFFGLFFALFGFLLKFSSGNPALNDKRLERRYKIAEKIHLSGNKQNETIVKAEWAKSLSITKLFYSRIVLRMPICEFRF